MRHFLGASGLNRVWLGLRQVESGYVSDSVEVLSALTIIAQTLFKSLLPYEHAYVVEKCLHNLFSYFGFSKKKEETKKKFVKTVAVRRALLDHNMEI